jgi:hypothetical protein
MERQRKSLESIAKRTEQVSTQFKILPLGGNITYRNSISNKEVQDVTGKIGGKKALCFL